MIVVKWTGSCYTQPTTAYLGNQVQLGVQLSCQPGGCLVGFSQLSLQSTKPHSLHAMPH